MLDNMLEKNLEIVKTTCSNLADPMETDGGIKLFKKAPPGIRMDAMGKCRTTSIIFNNIIG